MALTEGQKKAAEKNRKYWEQRELEQKKHYITEEKEYQKHLNKIYEDMRDNVQKEIEAFYGKYAKTEGITLAEAKKRVSQLDIEAYERKAKRYVEDKDFSKEANEEMRLYNATMKINRLEMLKANIGLELISGHEELQKYMEGILQGRTEDELKRQAGILGETIKDNAKAAHAIVNASFHNAKYSDRIWMHQDILKAELSKQLQSGLIQGKNPRVLAKNIRQKFDVSKASAETLMRTELARVQTEAQKLSFERNGFEQYTFLALGDACGICKELNDKHFYVKDMMPGTNAPPMHPNCRCSTSAYEDSEEYDKWLEHLEKGGTTEEWKKLKNKSNNGTIKASSSTIAMAMRLPNAKERSRVINEAINAKLPVYADDLRKVYNSIKPKGNCKDICLHGEPFFTEYEHKYKLDTETLSYIISGRRDYHSEDIRLLSCSTGKADKYGNCVAQELADRLGVNVYAPVDVLNIHPDGKLTVGKRRMSEDEGFRWFSPRKEG